jgi:hypothetical protein
MKKLFFFLYLLILLPEAYAMAGQVTRVLNINWVYPVAGEVDIAGFRVYNQDRVVVFDNIAPNLRTATNLQYTFDDTQVQAFHMVAIGKDGQITTPSNIGIFKPAMKPIAGVGTFTIELKP